MAVKSAALSTTPADAEHSLLVEGAADHLQAQRQAVRARPAGTEMPGRPARFAGTVNTSFRYIAIGSSDVLADREGGRRARSASGSRRTA